MMHEERLHDVRIPEIGSVPQAERMFRVNWIAAEVRSPRGIAQHLPDFVARLGRAARIVDVRTAAEVVGPLGHIPGSDWVPMASAVERLSTLDPNDPLVLVSRGGEQSGEVALALEARGFRFVSSLLGGVIAWRQVGLSTMRDAHILSREGVLTARTPTWEPVRRPLRLDEIERHVGEPGALRWMKLAAMLVSGRLSCVDGRDDAGVVGTPGGDAGEFLLALAALESVTGKRFDDASLRELMLCRLDAFGNFYLHTDVNASNAMIRAMREDRRLDEALSSVWQPLEWRRFLRSPPASVRHAVLDHALVPAHVGCGHLRLAMQRSNEYDVRPALAEAFLRTFLTLRWEGVEENEITVLPGGHAEGAVVNVLLEGGAEAFSQIPLVSPMAEGSQMFLQHPQVSGFLRGQLARFLGRQAGFGGTSVVEPLTARMSELGGVQLGHTLGALARGLPIFDVVFGDNDAVAVHARGEVPA